MPEPQKAVEHEISSPGAVLHGVGHQHDRLYGRVALKLVQAPGPETVDAGVMPHIRPRPAVAAELDIIEVRILATLNTPINLVLRCGKSALTRIGLDPDRQIQHLAVDCPPASISSPRCRQSMQT